MNYFLQRAALRPLVASLLLLPPLGCASDDLLDGEDSSFPSGKADGSVEEGSPEALAVLALVNDPEVSRNELDDEARLHRTAAFNIIDERDGLDGTPATADDHLFSTLAELDAVKFVGPAALEALLAYAIDQGYLLESTRASVIFSPQPLDSSHNARIAEMIDQAQSTIDIAMYSYSSAAISSALARAVERGVEVRFIFETARSKDKKLTGDALDASKSGRLERDGINVRYVNKIMHHKWIMIDGPRHEFDSAETARIASGSANWSTGGATVYDENTVFLSGVPEMALKLQREFNLMWDHSRDLVARDFEFEPSELPIGDESIRDNPDLDVYFTSDNFTISEDSTTFRMMDRQNMALANQWVTAIEDATDSIWVASGHMRLRPVAEALIAKKAANPNIDIQVYVDQQEYISSFGDSAQRARREDCLEQADTDNQLFDCSQKSFLWAKAIGDAGIEVRYKFYAYRWHFSYAEQMHNKFMIVDGDELYTGSYNLSINAEHGTFENTMHFKAPTFGALINSYEIYFSETFETGREELVPLRDAIANDESIPLVFASMALHYDEVSSLKSFIFENCPQVNSDEFRQSPHTHRSCPR